MKKVIIIFLGTIFILSNIIVSSAGNVDHYKLENSKGNLVNINIKPEAMGKITKQEISQIANENLDATTITIEEVGYSSNENTANKLPRMIGGFS